MTEDLNRKPHRLVLAPAPSHPRLCPTILNVVCSEDEDVEWQWTETPEGRYVSGYRLVPRGFRGFPQGPPRTHP